MAAAGKPVPEDKRHLLAESSSADLVGEPAGNPPPPPDPGVAGGPAAVPWDAAVLKPLFDAVIPEIEKADIEDQKAEAAVLKDQKLVNEVAKDAAWNPAAKATVIATGPQVTAKVLNDSGISAEHAPAIALSIAIAGIWFGRKSNMAKIRQIVESHAPKAPEAAA
jgi:hypothetical protein